MNGKSLLALLVSCLTVLEIVSLSHIGSVEKSDILSEYDSDFDSTFGESRTNLEENNEEDEDLLVFYEDKNSRSVSTGNKSGFDSVLENETSRTLFGSVDSESFNHNFESENVKSEPPLILTPLIEQGKLKQARNLSFVKPFLGPIPSYAGYFTVHKTFNSNTFFWYFPKEKDSSNAPVVLWLNGGPGSSSLFGFFVEVGPYKIKRVGDNVGLVTRLHSWHKSANIIFIDNPVGAGFSFTDSEEGYTRNQTVIGEQLHSAIEQFFTLFPELQKNEFYIAGESYAGKYVPALAYAIHKRNPNAKFKINLKGLFIGNGLTDPVNMMKYGDYVYQLGLIDLHERNVLRWAEKQIVKNVRKRRWSKATDIFGKYILGYYYYPYTPYFRNVTGLTQHFNYINGVSGRWTLDHSNFVNSTLFRKAIHVGDRPFNRGPIVAAALKEDILKSVIPWVVKLLNHYRIVFFNGQLDIICAYPLTERFLQKMKWKGAKAYKQAERGIWRVDNEVAGYYKQVGNLTEVVVRNAGHSVPTDQPVWGHKLFKKFLKNEPLS